MKRMGKGRHKGMAKGRGKGVVMTNMEQPLAKRGKGRGRKRSR